jgi:hypothetical protein
MIAEAPRTMERNGQTYVLVSPCDRCSHGTVEDLNDSRWRCYYCQGTGSYYRPMPEEPKS